MKERSILLVLGLAVVLAAPVWGQGLSLTKILTLTGDTDMDHFATSLDCIGDVNGDGFDDYVIGAPGFADNVEIFDREDDARVGRAYLYLGGVTPSDVAVKEFTGTVENQNLGAEVAGLGDINGDGFPDYAIGSNFLYKSYAATPRSLARPGFVNVYFGSADPANPQTLRLRAMDAARKDRFGTSMVSGIDFNGDGYNDLVVSAPGRPELSQIDLPCEDNPEETCKYRPFPRERIFVFYGGLDFQDKTDPDLTLELLPTEYILRGETFFYHESWFGETITYLGDVNSDGYDDFAANEPTTGSVYVYFGGESPEPTPGLVLSGESSFDNFGSCMARAGDINGDGHDDFMIGADSADHNGNDSGTVYVYHGGPELDATADLLLMGESASDRFGTEAVYAEDLDGDGAGDIAISARSARGGYKSNPTRWAGKVYVYYGGSAFDSIPDPVMSSWLDYEKFGLSLAPAGDVDNDGNKDLWIGAPLKRVEKDKAYIGSAYLFSIPQVTPVFNVNVFAEAQEGGALVHWNTIADEIPSGFRVSRGPRDGAVLLHEGFLSGTTESFLDRTAQSGHTYDYWVDVLDRAGNLKTYGPATLAFRGGVPQLLQVGLPYPNPMLGAEVSVDYQGKAVSAGVYDLQGRLVRTLDLPFSPTGGTLRWDGMTQQGTPALSGMYFLRVTGESATAAKRIIKVDQ